MVIQLSAQHKIGNSLKAEMIHDGPHDIMIVMKTQPNLNTDHIKGKNQKANYIYNALVTAAIKSQAKISNLLDVYQKEYRSFNIVNAISLKANNDLIAELSVRDDVRKIIHDPWFKIDLPTIEKSTSHRMADTTYGIQMINADLVWEMGHTGEGITIAGQDTGYDWDVDPIRSSYRGWNSIDSTANHNYNWFDAVHEIHPLHNDSIVSPDLNPCGLDALEPCDDNNHGTHTMGTMVGQSETEYIGVAPDANWIGCRSMERGWGRLSSYTECFEFFLAPTDLEGENPNPNLAPHVINNSWYCPDIEGCTSETWEVMEIIMNNLVQSGIFIVVSAGNAGPDCGVINSPPAIFESSFSVGAVNEEELIAPFSSRGPINIDSSITIAPHVVAPGVRVKSVIIGGEYSNFSGTSMAGPHTAGAVALLLSAKNELIGEVSTIKNILINTTQNKMSTQDCNDITGSTIPNAVYGYGLINAFKAIEDASVIATNNNVFDSEVKIFPNPSTGVFSIESKNKIQQIEIFNGTGRRMLSQSFNNTTKTEINLENLSDGFYIFKIHDETLVSTHKAYKF